jgi:hypothetical protein
VVAAVVGARRFCAARSGVEQDIGAGIISLTSAVGSGVSLVPAFGGAADATSAQAALQMRLRPRRES